VSTEQKEFLKSVAVEATEGSVNQLLVRLFDRLMEMKNANEAEFSEFVNGDAATCQHRFKSDPPWAPLASY